MALHKIDLNSQDFKRNPFPTFEKMREIGPLFQTKIPLLGKVWVTSTYEAATTVLRDKETFVVEPRHAGRTSLPGFAGWMPAIMKSLTNNMLGKDEPDHRRLRHLVESAFVKQSIDTMRPRIELIVDEYLNQVEQQALHNGGDVNFIKYFSRSFPLAVICELLGLAEDDREEFKRKAANFTAINGLFGIFKATFSVRKINKFLCNQFELCRKNPRPGMISALVTAEQDGDKLSEEELLASAFLLLIAGHETTVHLLNTGLLTFLQHPEQKKELMADWSKIGTAVDEVLRVTSTIQMTKPRYISRNIELFGQKLMQGDVVMPMLAAANCDPAQFPDPEVFDINRTPNAHIAFGTGIHVCLGLKLAKAEAEIAFQKIFTRFPNLQLAIPESEIKWVKRIGTRTMDRLPLRLENNANSGREDQRHVA